jgi:hypothetical protein
VRLSKINKPFLKIKGDKMKLFKSKKGIVTHPVMLFLFGVVLGLVLAYLWVNYTTIANPFC